MKPAYHTVVTSPDRGIYADWQLPALMMNKRAVAQWWLVSEEANTMKGKEKLAIVKVEALSGEVHALLEMNKS